VGQAHGLFIKIVIGRHQKFWRLGIFGNLNLKVEEIVAVQGACGGEITPAIVKLADIRLIFHANTTTLTAKNLTTESILAPDTGICPEVKGNFIHRLFVLPASLLCEAKPQMTEMMHSIGIARVSSL
jgi:hypothetical protein